MSSELEQSRRRLEQGLSELHAAVEEELGWAPRLGKWVALLIAGAVGFVAASTLSSRRRRRKALR